MTETPKAEMPEDVMEAAFALQTARMVGVSFMSREAADAIAAAILADRLRRVSKTVVKFEPQIVGSSYRFEPDQILEEAKGQGFTNRWEAYTNVRGKYYHFGTFDAETEAAAVAAERRALLLKAA